ncbi:MAG: sulfatase [Verrucomicrobia bacterium]|nr:sulfatase [Verrucomicrobiota bacterium]
MKSLSQFLFVVFWLASLATVLGREDRPNVLFIAVDDLNDWVGCLNPHPGVKTPHMDKLASSGVLFSNAHCTAPGCNPSRTSVMTGLRPSSTGVYSNGDDWRVMDYTKDVTTLPDSFQAAGYLTKGGGKLYHAHTITEKALTGHLDAEPWDAFFPSKERQMPAEVTPEQWPVNTNEDFYRGRFDWSPLDIEDSDMADAQVVTWAEEELSKEHAKPLFLAVGIYRPHWPWWAPQAYFDQHPLDEIELRSEPEDDLDDIPEAGLNLIRHKWHDWIIENQQREKAVQAYLASMTFADVMVGRLLSALENGPLADNTIIVLWSDHGYHLGSKNHWEKFALWEQATHVPLILMDSRTGKEGTDDNWQLGSRCNQPVSLLDLYPTLVELCGLADPGHLEGRSLVPLLKNPDLKTGRAIVTTHQYMEHAVRSENWRYIRYADGSEELYDHSVDPREFRNLAEFPEFSAVITYLADWLPHINVRPTPK